MSQAPNEKQPSLRRRSLFAGAGVVGAAAAATAVLPSIRPEELPSQPKVAPARGGGYSLSEHVKHYYKTTRI
ncbi:MAG: formate dehydrogenase [Burkholderiaceae bacterium]|jgi:hypothetical protein|nr:formate dehydrogenase [Burkholderiaceae bacterium]